MIVLDQKEKVLKSWHKEVFDVYNFMQEHNIVGSYIGPFDKYILVSIAKSLQNKLTDNQTQSKKFFKIFIELASNIAYYSHEKENGHGTGLVVITEYPDYLQINAGNIIDFRSKEHIEQKCKLINRLSHDELRQLRRYLLRVPAYNENSGNVGLVQVALVANNKLNYKFIPLNNEKSLYFYIISVNLSKEKN